MSDKENKTEDPTPKRLRDAKKKGQVAKSGDLNGAVSLLVFTIFFTYIGKYMFINGMSIMKRFLSVDYGKEMSLSRVSQLGMQSILHFLLAMLPIAILAMVVGVISNLVQTGFMFSGEVLKPNFSKLNPIEGFKNIFSKKALFTLAKNLLKLILVFYLFSSNLRKSMHKLLNSGNIGTERLFFFFIEFVRDLTFSIVIIMFGLGIVDFVFEKYQHKKNLRMSKQELKDEYKEMEGDPQLKSARQQRQRELSMGRMISNVGDATVVVTNPTRLAIAVRYDSEKDSAPIVLAKGAGHIAKKIREEAKDKEVPIIENKPLARAMYKDLEIGDNIPAELYQAMAEVLVLVYELEERKKGRII